MVHIVPAASAGSEYLGGSAGIDIAAGNIFELVELLDRMSPGFAAAAGVKLVFAVNGELAEDWTAPLPADAEILLVPRIGGGARSGRG